MAMKDFGRRISKEAAAPVIQCFWAAFRKEGNGPGGPTWVRLPTPRRVTRAIFLNSALEQYSQLYVLFEYRRDLRLASPAEVRQYFASLHPSQQTHAYVFPESLEWCIADAAKDNAGEDVILLSGQTTRFSTDA